MADSGNGPGFTDSTMHGNVESLATPTAAHDAFQAHGGYDGSTTHNFHPGNIAQEFEESHPPEGFMAAAGEAASTLAADHDQRYRHERHLGAPGVEEEKNAGEIPRQQAGQLSEEQDRAIASSDDAASSCHQDPADPASPGAGLLRADTFPNGYHFPPSYPWQESTKHGLLAFWKLFITPWGFFWIIYAFNVVAWGGMLFLLICNASPAMCHVCDSQGNCHVDCNDIDSPRRVWVEVDSQILNALFCVTGFGLAPWRFRDLYYLMKYRVYGRQEGLRRLAGINRGWFRLPGTQNLAPDVGPGNIPDGVPVACIPIPEDRMPSAPLTGVRAPPTAVWKVDFVIWCMVGNTIFQCALCGCMWGMNRYQRPSWTTGFLVAVGCIIAMVGGLMMFFEGRNVNSIEGVPCNERDLARLAWDKEHGISHYNNLGDKKPKEKVEDLESNTDIPMRRKRRSKVPINESNMD